MNLASMQTIFKEQFGYSSTSSYFAPGRINLIGEHIDYNGGLVFPASITLGTYAVVSPRTDQSVHAYSMNFEDLGIISFDLTDLTYDKKHNWVNYIKGVIKCLQDDSKVLPHGFDIVVFGNIPNGSGLSSSASLEMLIALILKDQFIFNLSPVDCALLGKRVENTYIGVNSGIMDQFAIALGQKDQALLLNCDTLEFGYFPIVLNDHKIVIMNTNKRRELADSKYNERRAECDSALAKFQTVGNIPTLCAADLDFLETHKNLLTAIEYKRVHHAISEHQRVQLSTQALESGDLATFGKLLNASHTSLRDDYEVTGIELDTLVEAAWDAPGVLGARMTGAGFGGCSLAIVENEQVDAFIETVSKKYVEKIGYEASFYIASIGNGPIKLN